VADGHFDEVRGDALMTRWPGSHARTYSEAINKDQASAWRRFFDQLASDTSLEMAQRSTALARQVRDNGVTYNVYADENGPQRPWSLDLFPLIVDATSWQRIESGVLQRVRLA
jgi:uncharacterized circularly permuted ATP-grasp superfamily protein